MNKALKVFCSLVMVSSLILSGVLLLRSIDKMTVLSSLEKELSVSRAHWENVASEKETLQEALTEVSDQLREATLTIEESETRAAELKDEVTQLETDILDLSSQLDQLGISSDPT